MATQPATTGARLHASLSVATRKRTAAIMGLRQIAETARLLAMKYATTVTLSMTMDAVVTVLKQKMAGRVQHQIVVVGSLFAQRSAGTMR